MNKTKEERMQEHLDGIKEIMSKPEVVEKQSWPQLDDVYWTVSPAGHILEVKNCNDQMDQWNKISGNMFKTEERAKVYREQIIVTQMLREIAIELNNGEKLDWNDKLQYKYSLYYSTTSNSIRTDCWSTVQEARISCLDKKVFQETAIERIGEERLINYFKNYK